MDESCYYQPGKMTDESWKWVRHFRKDEGGRNAFGDPLEMSVKLIFLLDALRTIIDLPISIHCGYATKGHADGSTHYDGLAVDLHGVGISAQSLLWEAMKLPFTGIGLYMWWNNPGLHLDIRRLNPGQQRKQWVLDKHGNYKNMRRMDLMFHS